MKADIGEGVFVEYRVHVNSAVTLICAFTADHFFSSLHNILYEQMEAILHGEQVSECYAMCCVRPDQTVGAQESLLAVG